MSIIVAPYPSIEGAGRNRTVIYKDEADFISEMNALAEKADRERSIHSLEEALSLYNNKKGCSHCVIEKQDYQSSNQWQDGVIDAARSLGWHHKELDWIYKRVTT